MDQKMVQSFIFNYKNPFYIKTKRIFQKNNKKSGQKCDLANLAKFGLYLAKFGL